MGVACGDQIDVADEQSNQQGAGGTGTDPCDDHAVCNVSGCSECAGENECITW
jgi:hypothetical protein